MWNAHSVNQHKVAWSVSGELGELKKEHPLTRYIENTIIYIAYLKVDIQPLTVMSRQTVAIASEI